MKDKIELFDEKKSSSGRLAGIQAANTDLLVVEHDQDMRLGTLAISCSVACWFNIVERDQDAGNPQTVLGPLRHNADGLIYLEEDFKDPILTAGADKELAIINLDAIGAGEHVAVSVKYWERRT